MFGNPGSTELPMLKDFPSDFQYVLGLQELVVMGMADGYAQASGTVGHANLHTAPGVGNAMGGIFNAQANHSPLLVTAGQQVRPHIGIQANLTNRDAIRMPHPLVKSSFEPARAADVPHALARAIHLAATPPKGPAFVSIPMDDWDAEADPASTDNVIKRHVSGSAMPNPDALEALAKSLDGAAKPVMIAGPDIDASGAWDLAVEFAEKQNLPVFAIPATGGGRLGFPEGHPLFRGTLPPGIAPVADTLKGYDVILVVGSSVFPYYPYLPGEYLPEGAELIHMTSDPEEAARAPMGHAVIGDVRLGLSRLLELVSDSDRDAGDSLPDPIPGEEQSPITGTAAMHALRNAFPDDGIIVLEAPSATLALRNQLRLSRPGSYYFGAGGGLGFGLAAAVGVQIAQPDRPVVCVIGEGSVQYAVTAFWTAAAYDVPLTVLVLRNSEYAILKWFAMVEQVEQAPGLDLPALDCAAIASAYGIDSTKVEDADSLTDALRTAIASPKPELVEVGVAPGMWLF
ncbi:MAG: benzoylformate decarboxylase [Solirubrobacterales bacterium]|nr:benzoylformate decarboxylase [Solirubrobacterales bacterium]